MESFSLLYLLIGKGQLNLFINQFFIQMKKIIFFIAAIIVAGQSQKLFAEGASCEEANPIQFQDSVNYVFENGQSSMFIEFEATEEALVLSVQNKDEIPTNSIDSVFLYVKNNCEELEKVYGRDFRELSTMDVFVFNSLTLEDNYLIELRRQGTLMFSSFDFYMNGIFLYSECPDITYDCGELMDNGTFSHAKIDFQYLWTFHFKDNIVCNWSTAGTPEIIYYDIDIENAFALLKNSGYLSSCILGDAIIQKQSLSSSKDYVLNFDLAGKLHRYYSFPGIDTTEFIDSFAVFLTTSNELDNITYSEYDQDLYKFIEKRDHCDVLDISNKQLIATVAENEMSKTLTSYTFCFSPNQNYDQIVFIPMSEKALDLTTGIDNISLKEFETLDLGADIAMDDCGLPVTIGPDCLYEGATYSWSPSNGLNDPNVANPVATPNSETTYTLTITIPGSNCQLVDDVKVTPSSTSLMSFDYIIPANEGLDWVKNNMIANGIGDNTFENYDIFISRGFKLDNNFNGEQLVFNNCNIHVDRESKIVIEEDFALINSTVETCDDYFWKGFEIKGNSAVNQDNLPTLSLNNSTIKNARVGISNGLTDENQNYIANTSGGHIKVWNSQFINNLVDAEFYPYINASGGTIIKDKSEFRNTDFISDQSLPSSLITQVHVKMEEVDGVKFEGCTFDNQLLQTNLNDRGIAIEAVDASFSVREENASNPSVFKGFHTAIYSYTQNPLYAPYVRKSHFENNVKGVSVNGNDAAIIIQNTFDIPDVSSTYEPFGLYLNYTNSYQIEENEFLFSGSGTANNAAGIVIYSSNQTVNQIYNNSFNNLQVGTLVHGDNKLANDDGLVIKCNDYDNDGFHIALNNLSGMFGTIYPEIALNQGGNANQTDPAGNTFNDLCSGSAQSDIFVATGGSAFNYYHHTNSVTEPVCRTTAKVTNIPTSFFFDKEEVCPTNLDGDGGDGGTGPGSGPGLVDYGNKREIEAKVRLLSNTNKSGDTLSDSLLNAYLRIQLMGDTIYMDSILQYLSYSSNAYNQLRGVAAMARKGDTTFGDKSLRQKMPKLAMDYAAFQKEAKAGNGRLFAKVKNDPAHPFYVWAKAAAKKKGGENIPAPLNLPQKREKTDDFKGNANDEVNVYPIPADQNIFIEVENAESIDVKLFDVQGRLVKTVRLRLGEKNHFSVANLNNGVYFIQMVKENGKIETQKVSIQH